jgi:Acyclic terpene utilisation family protein AtuA
MDEYRLLSTSGLLGYGFPEASLAAGMARHPDMIGVDGGSTDPGPYYLGSGKCLNSRMSMKRDLRLMLKAAISAKIPLIIGSCGGAGASSHLDVVTDIVREIAREESLSFRMAVIRSDQSNEDVRRWARDKRIKPLRNVPDITDKAIESSSNIVAMMGPEPFARALDAGAQVVLAGRSSDPAPWAASAMRSQLPPAPAWYAGKMLECGATASLPKGHDCLITTVRRNGVELEATNPIRYCTPMSVANHSLHENSSPCYHIEPGGMLDTSACTFEAVNDRAVFVSGMKWEQRPYTVKLEGAALVGYRAITICGTRDPGLINIMDDYLASVRQNVATKAADFGIAPESYKLLFRQYGRNGVMAEREPEMGDSPHEVGLLVEVVAPTQDEANAVLSIARVNTLHVDFPGRLCKEGNMAFPFSPSDVQTGATYRFSVFHVLEDADPFDLFPIEYHEV